MKSVYEKAYMCAKAKNGISRQMSVSVSPREICSLSVYGPSFLMAPAATRREMPVDCQKEKKRIPLTQRNLGTGLEGD